MKVLNILLVLGCLTIASACSNFLDVQPKDQQSEEQLFATKGGFYTATNGVYNKLASDELYGSDLSYGLVDLISKRYNPISSNTYFTALAGFDYGNEDVEEELEAIWTAAYNTILNCNVIIENVDANEGVLPEQEAAMIKGEMLAVRACLHFDMLRLFGPIYTKDHTAEAIPYNESAQVSMLPFLSADSVLNYKILRDLREAEQLLDGNDPVITGGPMASAGEETDDINLRYRQLRFNYYAVLGLMARVYLYAEDYTNALEYATKLLDDPQVDEWFPAVDPNSLLANSSNPDRVFSSEVLMGIYKSDREDIYTNYFNPEYAGSNLLQTRSGFVDGYLFAGGTQDYRYQSQWEVASGVGVTGHAFIKFREIDGYKTEEDPDEEIPYFYSLLMSMVRLSEMYYIAAESEPELADKYEWLNQIRERRGLEALPVTSEDDFMSNLRMEYLREFWGEGQIFFMYKRLNQNIMNTENGQNTSSYGASDARYVLPMPEGEIENR